MGSVIVEYADEIAGNDEKQMAMVAVRVQVAGGAHVSWSMRT